MSSCLSYAILQSFLLFCIYFNMFFPGCPSFFSSVGYGTVMNNHKVPWGYSIIRKKILNSYLTAKELRKDVPRNHDLQLHILFLYIPRRHHNSRRHYNCLISKYFFWSSLFCSSYLFLFLSHWDWPCSQILSSLNFWNFLLDFH